MDSGVIAAIVGGIIAALIVIILISGLAFCFYSSYRKSKDAKARERKRKPAVDPYNRRPTARTKRAYPRGVDPYLLPRGVPSASRKAQWNQRMLQYFYPSGGPYIMPAPYFMPRPFPQLPETRHKESTRDDESVSEHGTEEEVPPPYHQRPLVFAVPPMYYNFPMRGRGVRPQSSVVIREIDNDIPAQREPEVTHTTNEYKQHVTNITTVENDNPVVSSIPGDVIFGNSTEETHTTRTDDAHGLYSIIDSGLKKSTKVRSETVFNDPPPLSSTVVTREIERDNFQTYPSQNDSNDDVEYTVFLRRKNRESYTQDVPVRDAEIVNIAVDEALSQTVPRRPPTPPFDAVMRDSDTSLFATAESQKQDVQHFISSTRTKNVDSPFSLVYMDSIKQAVESRREVIQDGQPSPPLISNETSRFSYRPPTPPPLNRQISYEYYDNRGRDNENGENNYSKSVQFNTVAPVIIPDIRSDSFEVESPIEISPPPPPPPPLIFGNIPPAPPLPPNF